MCRVCVDDIFRESVVNSKEESIGMTPKDKGYKDSSNSEDKDEADVLDLNEFD